MAVKKFLKAAQEIQAQAARPRKDEKKHPVEEGEAWLVSYADMMTLLCGFFILLFSMAKLDEPQYEKVKESVSKQFGGEYHKPSDQMAKAVEQLLKDAGIEKQAEVKNEGTSVTVVFESTLFFETLSADVRPEARGPLKKLITTLMDRQAQDKKQYQIVVEGHTDSRPILAGAYASNWELSGARAARVVRFFLEQGFTSDRLASIGYADTRPQVSSRLSNGAYDEAALSKNRRVVLRILDASATSVPLSPPQGEAQAKTQAPVPPSEAAVTAAVTGTTVEPATPGTAPSADRAPASVPDAVPAPATTAH